MSLRAGALDDPVRVREADAELLSLALIDARNLLLRWLEVMESRGVDGIETAPGRCARRLAGRAGWYAEYWIARHPQRARGEHCDPSGVRLASVHPQADAWFAPGATGPGPADGDVVRAYLAETMDTTLELLAGTAAQDDALHFFRGALVHEDRLCEALAETAAMLQIDARPDPHPPWPELAARAPREPVWLPAQRLTLGSPHGGYVPDNERWAHEVAVPECEIDALPVSWARYVEFAEDGGYDRRELWSDAGWAWLEATARRAPRDVEQLRGGVLVQRHGRLQRAAAAQPAQHVSRHEAEAWCRWAKRRLPTEPEWELAALTATSRGFAWGDVFEWVAGSAKPWPGFAPTPGTLDRMPPPGSEGVLRGASFATLPRQRNAKARRFAPPEADAPFCGFRSCTL